MASIFSSKSKSFMTMSIPPQGEPSINQSMASYMKKMPLIMDLALYDNESWNDPRDFAKQVKVISLPQNVPSTSDRHLIELKNQVQRLMEAHLAPYPPVQVNKIASSCEICSGPRDTQYCMENLEQAFVDYASSRTNEVGGKWYTFKPEQNNLENDGDVMFVELIKKYDDSSEAELGVDESVATGVEYFDKFPTRSELAYHKYLMYASIPSLFLRNPIIIEGNPSNLKIPCNIGHVHVEKAYIDLNSSINVMTCMQYNWIMRKQLEPREDLEGIRGISNFTRRIRGMHIFVGNFTYVSNFMIVEDINSIINP
ncbi:hypothetical protein Tco_0994568 [Tanacetum coccineum]